MTAAALPLLDEDHLSLLERIALLDADEQQQMLGSLTPEAATKLLSDWHFWARPNQIAPGGEWTTWLIQSGRGWGKTRTGAQWVKQKVEEGCRRIALVAATSADARDVMVEGESGILSVYAHEPEANRPIYEPGRRRVRWPNGAIATLYSAEEPRRLRGPQHDAAWGDELAAWQYPETYDMLLFGLRLGKNPQVVFTTTPKPTPLIRDLNKRAVLDVDYRAGKTNGHADVILTVGSTYENISNLAGTFIREIVRKYEGTTLGQQELYARLIEDVEGALWNSILIEQNRVSGQELPNFKRIAIGVDPAVTSKKSSDETGIIVAALGDNGHAYVLRDGSGKMSPNSWATRVVNLYGDFMADRIVGEVNNGGDLVETIMRNVDSTIAYKGVNASRGKTARAEPIVSLYEQGKVHHVGFHALLESQMTTWRDDLGMPSPDRMDALVWVLTELMLEKGRGVFVLR